MWLANFVFDKSFRCVCHSRLSRSNKHRHRPECATYIEWLKVRTAGYTTQIPGIMVGTEDSGLLAGLDHNRRADISVASLYCTSTAAIEFSTTFNVDITILRRRAPILPCMPWSSGMPWNTVTRFVLGIVFKTFVLGSHGGFDSHAEELLSLLALAWSLKHGITRDDALHSLRMSFSVARTSLFVIEVLLHMLFLSLFAGVRYFPMSSLQVALPGCECHDCSCLFLFEFLNNTHCID